MLNVAEIIADGVVDAQEAAEILKEFFSPDGDGGAMITLAELETAFEINDNTENNSPEWDEAFVKIGTSYALDDDETPNVADADECANIIRLIGQDGVIAPNEKALVANIIAKAKSVDQSLIDFAAANGIA